VGGNFERQPRSSSQQRLGTNVVDVFEISSSNLPYIHNTSLKLLLDQGDVDCGSDISIYYWEIHKNQFKPRLITELTLEALLDSHTVAGSFQLPAPLLSCLAYIFRPTLKMTAEQWTTKFLGEGSDTKNMRELLNTVMTIIYIEERFTEEEALWTFVLQKARAWVEGLVPVEKHRIELFELMKNALRTGSMELTTASEEEGRPNIDDKKKGRSTSPTNADLNSEPVEESDD
jgi:hypothetical protein